ncbi:hypothetical protein [Luteimonas panaciterrae]|uniref:hypothetical protein n=1 Tax=Luteimonas panaciterrae TaxID=363885 RepID=UPI001CFAF543|nr:hypothetical protein [Luteimonas panaciterrae]
MGSFSIFHWLITLGCFLVPVAVIVLVIWLVVRKREAPPPIALPPVAGQESAGLAESAESGPRTGDRQEDSKE